MDADTPVAGFYRVRLVRGGPWVAVRIWYGPPHDPETGEEMDRSWRWQATRDGKVADIDRVWPWCGANPITEAEYQSLTDRAAYVRAFSHDDVHAQPSRRIDLLSAPVPKF